MAKQYDYLFKLLLIGDSGVGKTCLILRYTDDMPSVFSQSFIPTIGIDFKIRTIDIDNKKVKLQIWDTAGQERFRTITTSYYRGAAGIMMVYAVNDKRSFDNIMNWTRTIEEHAGTKVHKMIIGNKCDMEEERVVSPERGELLALKNGMRFMETSAKSAHNVDAAFEVLARDIKASIDENEGGRERKSVVLKPDVIRVKSSWLSKMRCSLN